MKKIKEWFRDLFWLLWPTKEEMRRRRVEKEIETDFAKIEARVLAAIGDGETDLHKITAAEIYGIDPEEVTDEQRRVGKSANFYRLYDPTWHGTVTGRIKRD